MVFVLHTSERCTKCRCLCIGFVRAGVVKYVLVYLRNEGELWGALFIQLHSQWIVFSSCQLCSGFALLFTCSMSVCECECEMFFAFDCKHPIQNSHFESVCECMCFTYSVPLLFVLLLFSDAVLQALPGVLYAVYSFASNVTTIIHPSFYSPSLCLFSYCATSMEKSSNASLSSKSVAIASCVLSCLCSSPKCVCLVIVSYKMVRTHNTAIQFYVVTYLDLTLKPHFHAGYVRWLAVNLFIWAVCCAFHNSHGNDPQSNITHCQELPKANPNPDVPSLSLSNQTQAKLERSCIWSNQEQWRLLKTDK